MYGDLNGDETVNSIDYAYMKSYLLGMMKEFPSENGLIAADVNGDEDINSVDYALMKMYLLGMIKEFPAASK